MKKVVYAVRMSLSVQQAAALPLFGGVMAMIIVVMVRMNTTVPLIPVHMVPLHVHLNQDVNSLKKFVTDLVIVAIVQMKLIALPVPETHSHVATETV